MTSYRHTYAVTGAAGFIGTNLAYYLSEALAPDERIVLIDKLTYAGNYRSIEPLIDNERVSSCRQTSAMPKQWTSSSPATRRTT